jgi:hypothetical protein
MTRNLISRNTVVTVRPNNLTGKIGRYRVAVRTDYGWDLFETDQEGYLFYQKGSEKNPVSWVDTGETCLNKTEFVNAVLNWMK